MGDLKRDLNCVVVGIRLLESLQPALQPEDILTDVSDVASCHGEVQDSPIDVGIAEGRERRADASCVTFDQQRSADCVLRLADQLADLSVAATVALN